MIEDHDKNAFRLDPQAKSFQITGFRWRDTPVWIFSLVLSVALLTGLNFFADRSLSFLDRDSKLFVGGTLIGFGAGVWVRRFSRSLQSVTISKSDSTNPVLSPADAK